jgi:hypothetical protein
MRNLIPGDVSPLCVSSVFCKPPRALTNELIPLMRHALVMNDVHRIFIHLFYYHLDYTFTPDIVFISDIDFRVYLEVLHKFGILNLLPLFLPLLPLEFNRLGFATFHQLINYVINFEALYQRLVSIDLIFWTIEVAHKASLFVDKIVIQATITVWMSA